MDDWAKNNGQPMSHTHEPAVIASALIGQDRKSGCHSGSVSISTDIISCLDPDCKCQGNGWIMPMQSQIMAVFPENTTPAAVF